MKKEITLDHFQLSAHRIVTRELFNLEPRLTVDNWPMDGKPFDPGRDTGKVLVHAIVKVWGKDTREVTLKFPANWWQHWKEDHAPKWFLRRWPVNYMERKVHFRTIWPYNEMKFPRRMGSMVVLSYLDKEQV